MASAETVTAPEKLAFAKSTSKVLGVTSKIQGFIPEKIIDFCHAERQKEYDNAPRIIGVMKMGMDVTIAMSGNPWFISYAVFAVIGRLITITWGSKKHQEKLAREKAEGKHQNPLGHSWRDNDRKILHPREYPVEAAAGLSLVAEMFGMGFGIAQFFKGATGYTAIVTELIALWSYGNIIFHREKKNDEPNAPAKEKEASEPLTFDKSQSKPVGITGRLRQAMKDNPVFASSMANVFLCCIALVGGYAEGYGVAYLTAFVIGGVANVMQGLLVRKNDYNIEGAGQNQVRESDKRAISFEERLAEQRSRGNDLGAQPA